MSWQTGSGSERKVATVVFADLVGSTASASAEDPERVRLRLERFYEAMADEIESAGGTVEKFAGDAVMAVFGVPAALEDHAERALHAALAMHHRLGELFAGQSLRIGVNTGDVVVGRPREGSSFVSGDAVNVAARLEQAAAPGETLVGERTVASVRGAFEFATPHIVEAKGKRDGVTCRRLVRALSLMRPRGVGSLNSAFVGRERELGRLQDAYQAVVAAGAPALVAVEGDAGVGKTRLVRELSGWLTSLDPQPWQRTGRCLPYGQTAFWALGEMLKEHLGLLDGDPPEIVLHRLGEREILGLALGLDVAPALHPLVARDRFQDAWVDLLTELAAERPLVLQIEDVHWADPSLLELVEHVLAHVRGAMLVLATARPEFHDTPGFGRQPATFLELEPLEVQETRELVERLLGVDLPGPLSAVVDEVEGNPFFLEEILASLIDQGLLRRADGAWAMGELPTGFVIPDSVHAVVASRIDLLDPPEKEALQAGSVIGRSFWSGPVYELCAGSAPDLRQLEQRDFVRLSTTSSIEGEREYVIKHAVTREVAYASIPRAKRAHLHAAFADWLEGSGGRQDEYAPILAHHYAQAAQKEDADLAWADAPDRLDELRRKAVAWLQRAAQLARGRYEIDEALALLTRALELEPSRPEASAIWHDIARAHILRYDGEPFWDAMQKAIDLADDPDRIADMHSDLVRESVLRAGMWRKALPPEQIDGWMARAVELMPAGGDTRAKVLIAESLWGGSAARAAEASAIALQTGNPDLRFSALMVQSSVAFREHDYTQALARSEEALALGDTVSDPELVADPDLSAVWPAMAVCRFARARELGAKAHDRNLGLTPHHGVHAVAVPMEIEELLGDWTEIGRMRDEVIAAVYANLETPCVRNARSIALLALVEEIAGNSDEATALLAQAEELKLQGHGLATETPRVRLELLRGNLDEVERLLGEDDVVAKRRTGYHLSRLAIRLDALAALRDSSRLENEAPVLIQEGTYLEPFALRALGIVRVDESLVERAQERFEAIGLAWHAAQTERLGGL